MERQMRVAVVVPCHDDGETLAQALASLAGQEPHELVVVDDGSTDPSTLETLRELDGQGTRVLHQSNAGLAAARMAGVRATSASLVMPLDADDELTPGALARMADALGANPRAGVAWGDVEIFGSVLFRVRTADALDPWQISYLSEIPGTSMVRRRALEEAGGWQFTSQYEDWDLWMAFAERGWEGVRVPEVTLRYRREQGRMNADGIVRHGEIYRALRERHPDLFARRREAWRRSSAPLQARLLYPLLGALPGLSQYDKFRLQRLVNRPGQVLRSRRARRRAGEAPGPLLTTGSR
jgi:glycosyltransferase involved in cell wall biosynthesis